MRWVFSGRFFHEAWPYPFLPCLHPVQIQQDSVLVTLSQNRCSCWAISLIPLHVREQHWRLRVEGYTRNKVSQITHAFVTFGIAKRGTSEDRFHFGQARVRTSILVRAVLYFTMR